MAQKLGGLSISLPEGETLLLVWRDGSQSRLQSQGLIDAETLWLSMPDKDNPPFLKTLGLRRDHEVEPFPGVRMTCVDPGRKRVRIQASRDLVTVLRGNAVRTHDHLG